MQIKLTDGSIEIHKNQMPTRFGAATENALLKSIKIEKLDDYFIDEDSSHISTIFEVIYLLEEFNKDFAYKVASIVNALKPENNIDWQATFNHYKLGVFDVFNQDCIPPIIEIINQGYTHLKALDGGNKYCVVNIADESPFDGEYVSLYDPKAFELYMLYVYDQVEIANC